MKRFILFVAFILMATSALAMVEGENGSQHIANCFAIGTAPMTSGNVVVLTSTVDSGTRTITYWGREVTGSATKGRKIYGVVVGSDNYSAADMADGKWIRVQTYGYCPIVKLASFSAVTNNSSLLCTAGQSAMTDDTTYPAEDAMKAAACQEVNGVATIGDAITGNSIALESKTGLSGGVGGRPENCTFKAWLGF